MAASGSSTKKRVRETLAEPRDGEGPPLRPYKFRNNLAKHAPAHFEVGHNQKPAIGGTAAKLRNKGSSSSPRARSGSSGNASEKTPPPTTSGVPRRQTPPPPDTPDTVLTFQSSAESDRPSPASRLQISGHVVPGFFVRTDWENFYPLEDQGAGRLSERPDKLKSSPLKRLAEPIAVELPVDVRRETCSDSLDSKFQRVAEAVANGAALLQEGLRKAQEGVRMLAEGQDLLRAAMMNMSSPASTTDI